MKIVETPIEGLFIIEPQVFGDNRGYFLETFRESFLKEAGINTAFVQDNESRSIRGVVRGLHYQINPFAQAKLVRVVSGTVFDVAVDLRRNSPTFKKWFGLELSGENKKQLYIPRGFAHGFSVLSETAVFAYKCDAYYQQNAERGILFNDPELNINWKLSSEEMIVSGKDQAHHLLKDADFNFDEL